MRHRTSSRPRIASGAWRGVHRPLMPATVPGRALVTALRRSRRSRRRTLPVSVALATLMTASALTFVFSMLMLAPRRADAQRLGALRGLSLAGGVDGRSLAGREPGTSALVGYDVTRGGGALQARLTGTFFDRATEDATTRFGGIGLDVKLVRRVGSARPYLLGGAGVYRLREERSVALGDVGTSIAPLAADSWRRLDDRASLALTVGGGLLVPLGSVAGFAEGRYTAFPAARLHGGYLPVVAGVRF